MVLLHRFYAIFSLEYVGFYLRAPDSFRIVLLLDQETRP